MRRIALVGLALSIGGAIGVVSSALIGTAYASRQETRDYLLAVSSGDSLRITAVAEAPFGMHRAVAGRRGLLCQSVYRLPGVDIGYLCRRLGR